METKFVLAPDDEWLIDFFKSLGLDMNHRVLGGYKRQAFPGEIALFSASKEPLKDPCLLMGRQIVFASHRLIRFRPDWAGGTPFCHLVRSPYRTWRGERFFYRSLGQLVEGYKKFCPATVDEVVPWGIVEKVRPREETLFNQRHDFEAWQAEVKALL